MDFEDKFGKSVVFLSQESESAFDLRTDLVLSDNLTCSGLLRGDFMDSDFTLFNVIFSLNKMPMNFPDNMIQPVNFFKQENTLKIQLCQFLFNFFWHNILRSCLCPNLTGMRFL